VLDEVGVSFDWQSCLPD